MPRNGLSSGTSSASPPARDVGSSSVDDELAALRREVGELRSGIAALVVADHGIGSEGDDGSRIFGWFERGRARQRGGFGVGLWLVDQLCAAMTILKVRETDHDRSVRELCITDKGLVARPITGAAIEQALLTGGSGSTRAP